MKALTTWPQPRPRPRGPRWHWGLQEEHKSLINMGQYMHSRITTHKFNICLHLTNKEFQRWLRQEARQHMPVDTGLEDTTPSPVLECHAQLPTWTAPRGPDLPRAANFKRQQQAKFARKHFPVTHRQTRGSTSGSRVPAPNIADHTAPQYSQLRLPNSSTPGTNHSRRHFDRHWFIGSTSITCGRADKFLWC